MRKYLFQEKCLSLRPEQEYFIFLIPAKDRELNDITNSFAVISALVGLQGLHWGLFLYMIELD